jgi:hypothetical protein
MLEQLMGHRMHMTTYDECKTQISNQHRYKKDVDGYIVSVNVARADNIND